MCRDMNILLLPWNTLNPQFYRVNNDAHSIERCFLIINFMKNSMNCCTGFERQFKLKQIDFFKKNAFGQ